MELRANLTLSSRQVLPLPSLPATPIAAENLAPFLRVSWPSTILPLPLARDLAGFIQKTPQSLFVKPLPKPPDAGDQALSASFRPALPSSLLPSPPVMPTVSQES